MDPITVGAALKAAEEWQTHFGLLSSIKAKLVGSPKAMLQNLDRALDEIDRTCEAFEKTVALWASLVDAPTLKSLTELSGGVLLASYEKGRGHCMVVDEIYRDHLKTWFNDFFQPDYKMIEAAFGLMQQADNTLFLRLGNVAQALQVEADRQLTIRTGGGAIEVKQIEDTFVAIVPVRKEVAKLWQSLRATRNGIQAALV